MKIKIIGSFLGSDGYSSHTRQLFGSLANRKDTDMKIETQLPQDWIKHVSDNELAAITKPDRKDDWNIIITMPHMWRLFTGLGKNCGYVIWEGSHCPVSWIDEFLNPKIDLIFVPSNHTKQAIINTIKDLSEDNCKIILEKLI